jgi:hypothetical protein
MIKKIKWLIWYILIKLNLGGSVQLILASGLRDDGWFESFNTKSSINKNGDPISWYTYSFITFLEPRLKKDFKVFEYGSGNSTFWYAERVGYLKCVEHDKKWYERNRSLYPANVNAILKSFSLDGSYANEINADDIKYNIIIIDGVDRNNCVRLSINKLTDDGVVIYDNTQVQEYKASIEFLLQQEFKKIDFEGLLPIVSYNNTTTIFYRINNCLDI